MPQPRSSTHNRRKPVEPTSTPAPAPADADTFEYDAFLSYSHDDGPRIDQIYATLTETFKLRVCRDSKEFGPGPLYQQCAEGIQRSRFLVIACSRSSLKSDWVLAESDMMRARDPRGRSIIPIVLDGSTLPLQLETLLRVDFTNHGDDEASTARLAELLRVPASEPQPAEETVWIAAGSPSPFQGAGTIPPQKDCYVRRSTDHQLRSLVAAGSLVWIQGEYRMGKSSLLARYRSWIPDGWHLSRPALDLCSRDDFWRDFFAEIQRASVPPLSQDEFKPVKQWQALQDLILRTPFVLILDEIGACDGAKGQRLLKALLAISESRPDRFKCIAAFKGRPQDYLTVCKCDVPRLSDCWQLITLGRFEHSHVQELAELLPAPVARAITARMEKVEGATELRPHAVQQLMDRIWRRFQGFVPPSIDAVDAIVEEQLATFSAT